MEQKKSQKKEIGKDARDLINQGMPKQQVFETLVDKYKYSKAVVEVLKGIPSLNRIRKYRGWNNLLLFFLIIIELTSLLFAKPSLGILWYGILIYAVAKKMVSYYNWITFLSIIGTLFTIGTLAVSEKPVNMTSVILLIVIYAPTCILPIWLEKRLCPEPTERKEMYTNEEGDQRMKLVYEFNDEIT